MNCRCLDTRPREPLLRTFESTAGLRRAKSHYWFGCNPMLDPLRSDERFKALMKRLEVEPCEPVNPWRIPARK